MADLPFSASRDGSDAPAGSWRRELTRYHWFVLIVAALGWLFDCLDQQLFNLARVPAMKELLAPSPGVAPNAGDVDFHAGVATSIFLLGWATGGIIFGILGDRIGRARTMLLTILVYSLFTGLSALSRGFWDFALYRFLTGLGVGGEFAVGVALVAEVMPSRARPFALGLLQALSTVGNVSAAAVSMALGHLEQIGAVSHAWRWMFVVGTLPALLAIVIRRRLKEPERWQAIAAEGRRHEQLGSIAELFGDPRWRSRAIMGMFLASAGVVGLWGIGFFSIDLNRSVFRKTYESEARVKGEAVLDRKFVQWTFAARHNMATAAETQIQPSDLLSLDPGNRDPQLLYELALALHKQGQPATVAAVMAALDQGDEAKKRKPQTRDDLKRRMNYLDGAFQPDESAAKHAARITSRTKEINGRLSWWAGITSLMFNLGAFFGITTFSRMAHRHGRRPTFAVAFLLALVSTALTFLYISDKTVVVAGVPLFADVFWMIPIMGFCQISLFGGYAIYFPELFPTRLRSTGTSFCYNVGRFFAAGGPYTLGYLSSNVFGATEEPLRWAGLSMCAIFLLGLAALPFAPETRGQPLPE